MAEVLQFHGKAKPSEYSDMLRDLAESSRGHVSGGVCILVTDDGAVHVICGPDLDATLATVFKLQAILTSMYANNLVSQ